MIKNISAWAIKHPVPPVVLFVVLFFLGVVAFIRLPINLSPDISFPLVEVTVNQPGAAPTEIETQIIQKIEGSVASVGNVKNITSAALEGAAFVYIEFQIGTPVDRAVTDVRDAVSKVRSNLPEGIEEPLVQRDRRRRRSVRVLRRQHYRHDGRRAQLVRRQRRHQALAGRERRGAGAARRRRRSRDPRRARSLRACRRSDSRRWTSISSCARSTSTRRVGACRLVAANSRFACWVGQRLLCNSARHAFTCPAGASHA